MKFHKHFMLGMSRNICICEFLEIYGKINYSNKKSYLNTYPNFVQTISNDIWWIFLISILHMQSATVDAEPKHLSKSQQIDNKNWLEKAVKTNTHTETHKIYHKHIWFHNFLHKNFAFSFRFIFHSIWYVRCYCCWCLKKF